MPNVYGLVDTVQGVMDKAKNCVEFQEILSNNLYFIDTNAYNSVSYSTSKTNIITALEHVFGRASAAKKNKFVVPKHFIGLTCVRVLDFDSVVTTRVKNVNGICINTNFNEVTAKFFWRFHINYDFESVLANTPIEVSA